ncbi:protease modulator HflC [Pacificimonas flava]|uniref:Protease modulator HflC n=2 Tax=Pacificimonas TaxID=1960290 RepID=A0A219B4E2_9SPHN|nr:MULTISPECIES: protease modulator HflC [Pacificimonas]MBZ6377034.1 protease modulator HflC [Pacificimonas aurantium]OWV33225.1 protease modulator HflC [Pacificimonas flava]
MSLKNPILLLAILFALLVVAATSAFTVSETQQAIVLRLGEPNRIINAYDADEPFGRTSAGVHLKIPFLEEVVYIDKRVLDLDMEQQTVLSTDQLRVVVDAFARFRITEPLRMYQSVGTEERAADQLSQILTSRLRNELGRQNFAALLSPERGDLMNTIQEAVNRAAQRYGAELIDVRIKRADLPTGQPLESAFERMRTAREQEARRIRAEGDRQARVIRAEADAEAARIYAESFGQDEGFYEFYRAMEAYRTAFQDGGANVVLSPENEFLEQFQGNVGQ